MASMQRAVLTHVDGQVMPNENPEKLSSVARHMPLRGHIATVVAVSNIKNCNMNSLTRIALFFLYHFST